LEWYGEATMAPSHILIIEDEKHARLTLSLALRQAGYRISLAGNGKEALEMIEASVRKPEPLDLLISDIQMPELDGLEMIDRLQEQGISIPVIGISGFGDKELVVELLRRGCRDYLDKPFTPEEVVARVEKVLRQTEAVRDAEEVRCRRIREDRLCIQQEIDNYKERFERLSKQLDSAVDAYHGIMKSPAQTKRLPLAWRHRSLAGLGGDFFAIQDIEIGCDILLADVAGHDVAASYNAVLIKTFFDENCRKLMDLQTFLRLLNLHLFDKGKRGQLITAIFLRLDLESKKGYVAAAGHPPLLIAGAHCRPRLLEVEGSGLGAAEHVDFSIHQFQLEPGDRYFLYTDGVLAARRPDSPSGEELGAAGLMALLQQVKRKMIDEAVRAIWEGILTYCSQTPADDLSLIGLEIPGDVEEGHV
jgi:sigma-B regulation protein RsbU (phosphoserine phosphatase)